MMPLDAALGAVGGIGPGFFPRPWGLCGAMHPRVATARRARRPDRSAVGAGARSLPRCRARPSVGTGGAASSLFHTRAPRPSTDTGCVGRRGHHLASDAAASTAAHPSAETLPMGNRIASRSDSTARRAPSRSSLRLVAAAVAASRHHRCPPRVMAMTPSGLVLHGREETLGWAHSRPLER
jgi:hypothetical protein